MRNERNDNNRNQQAGRGSHGGSARQASATGNARNQGSGSMSVREAGHKGGQRVSELVEKGKRNGS
ncbi:MAG: Em GEA1 (EM1) [Lysobacter sp.]|nr:Em GEA1 (EM1) [Lysobacter sp.]